MQCDVNLIVAEKAMTPRNNLQPDSICINHKCVIFRMVTDLSLVHETVGTLGNVPQISLVCNDVFTERLCMHENKTFG